MKTLLLAMAFLPAASGVARAAWNYPPAPLQPVTNQYNGAAVVDNYQWLENFDDPAVKSWNAAENKISRAYFDALPARDRIAARLRRLYSGASANYFGLQSRPGRMFASKFKPPAQQPWLVELTSLNDLSGERVVLDPNKLSARGSTAIDFWVPSHDGKHLAVSLSQNGSEEGTIFIYDTAAGKPLPDQIPRVQFPTGGGSVAWNSDDTGVYYTRYPAPGERPPEDLRFFQQIYFHRLGAPVEGDRYELGKDFPRIAEIGLESRRDGRWLLATVANGDGGEFAHYILGPGGQWRQITRFSDKIILAAFGRDDALYLLSRDGAPHGKILRLPLDAPDLTNAAVVVPESDAVIEGYTPTERGLYVSDLVGGPSQIRYFRRGRDGASIVPLPPVSAVTEMLSPDGDKFLFRDISFTAPYVWMSFDPAKKSLRPTALFGSSPADFGDIEVVREYATSRDGAKIPLNILRPRGVHLDGRNPTILYGYGGYGINLTPNFIVSRRVWFDQGGVYVIANLRGGGEFGEEWHKAGNLAKKQNVFDDFIAAAEWLIDHRYTNPDKLAAMGRSNGGLLMGAALTQRPDLFRAVVSGVGIYDSLRSELEPNGAFNVTEFGTVKDPAQFAALYAYSPYHHVVNGADYPAVLLTTGDHDGRVNPFHSRKMAARLQAANASDHPILLRTTAAAGHGIGTSLDERIAEEADTFAFLFDQLGVDYREPAR